MAEIALAGATAALRQTVGVLGNLVLKEGSRLSRLQEDIVWIGREMRHIQAYLEDAEAKQGGSRGVANLVIEIQDLACDVEDIMQKYLPRIASHSGKKFLGCLKSASCIVCYGYDARNFAVEIEGIKRRVEDIPRVRQTYGINEPNGSRGRDMCDEIRILPHSDEPNVVGFEGHIEDLVAKMLNEELQCRVISIIGMAGLGKTTLAKKIFQSAQHNFERSAWIYVSQQPNIKELLRDIAGQVGLEKKKWEENFNVNLSAFLSQHRYVIVFDDMWHIGTWDAIKNVIPTNTENGSRIILTSRNNCVGTYVGTHVGGKSSLHELRPLNEENSRKLFFERVIVEASDPPQLKTVGEQILKRCGGVPLAIVLAAGLLLSTDRLENAWKGILEGMGQDQDQCSKIFGLSYKDLPTNLKPCFLYFGLFPEDHEISAFKLVNLWAAEGFIRGSGVREVEDVGDDYLNHLIARNLIQVVRRRFDGKVRSCRIHDILHNLCIREAKEINFFNTQSDVITCNRGTGVRRVTTHGSNFEDYISLNYPTPRLRSMLSFSGNLRFVRRKMVKNFLRDFEFLRVLSVKCDYLPRALPNEVGNLKNLHYLGLGSRGYIEIPHTISNLKGLLTFDVQGAGVILPDVIWTMKQLRHILLPLYCVTNLHRTFHRIEICLPNLQTLYGLTEVVRCDFNFLHKLVNLRKLHVKFSSERIIEILSDPTLGLTKLEKLVLLNAGGEMLRTLNLSRYENLLTLKLGHFWWFRSELPRHHKLPPNLTKLTLFRNFLQEDPMETLKELPRLKILKLYSNSYLGSKMVCPGAPGCNFPQLEVLKIDRLEGLRELIVKEGGMPRLKELGIFQCNPITRVYVPDRIKNIMEIDNYR
ncbi:Disease resistance RPP8-like protein 3 [Camellia lanceoleosa]|uniref:Disease resistance RPP8-like protein 3 n=1 Tax=Camellia lanceoleosa TaxID=1840588 RepID=A0ACC0I8L2_9ERIC|nr:Disease resistance RPP8-like protein 3 [Camellia lanceoleosa]